MESDYQLVTLSPELAAALGHERLFVEAVELAGGAIFRGAWMGMRGEGTTMVPQGRVDVPREHEAALEQLFAEACRAGRGPEYHDARHASGRARGAARGIKTYGNSFGTLSRNRRAW